jgi:hypothetical protein
MSLQDTWIGDCRAATVQWPPVNHSQCVATVPNDPTTECGRAATVPGDTTVRCHVAHGRDIYMARQDIIHVIKDIISYF